jgi:hypothetical protein
MESSPWKKPPPCWCSYSSSSPQVHAHTTQSICNLHVSYIFLLLANNLTYRRGDDALLHICSFMPGYIYMHVVSSETSGSGCSQHLSGSFGGVCWPLFNDGACTRTNMHSRKQRQLRSSATVTFLVAGAIPIVTDRWSRLLLLHLALRDTWSYACPVRVSQLIIQQWYTANLTINDCCFVNLWQIKLCTATINACCGFWRWKLMYFVWLNWSRTVSKCGPPVHSRALA